MRRRTNRRSEAILASRSGRSCIRSRARKVSSGDGRSRSSLSSASRGRNSGIRSMKLLTRRLDPSRWHSRWAATGRSRRMAVSSALSRLAATRVASWPRPMSGWGAVGQPFDHQGQQLLHQPRSPRHACRQILDRLGRSSAGRRTRALRGGLPPCRGPGRSGETAAKASRSGPVVEAFMKAPHLMPVPARDRH